MELECKSQDNGIPVPVSDIQVPELLGSVTQQTDSEGGIQLRTSARVSKKLKLDSLAQATQSTSEKKEVSHEEEKKIDPPTNTEGKPRAKRVDWSVEDKFAFFEALNEFGKDIDAIHNYLVMKAKRRGGGQEVKTKDQVRFFYYRMWSILSKHINFPSYIKKQTQELYALINFGELRKKISLSNKKHYEKLSEMIYSGSTQLKFRGKVRKVRTPLCKALRKLNHIEESSEELRLPSCVTVELRPRHTEDWCRVQALAQNPRVRSVLPLHRRLESLLAFLNQRWQTEDHKLREQLVGSGGGEEGEVVEEWALHVGPKGGTQGSEPTVRLSEVATSSKLSLLAYEQRFHPAANQVHTLLDQLPVIHRGKGRGVKRPRADSLTAKEAEDSAGEAGRLAAVGAELKALGPEVLESAVGQLLSLNCFTDNAQVEALSPRVNGDLASPVKEAEEVGRISVDQAHSGWTLATSGSVRVGDVYMMFGGEGKVQLDYWWEKCSSTITAATAAALLVDRAAVETATAVAVESEAMPPPDPAPVLPVTPTLAATLQKLLYVAKVELCKSKPSASNPAGSDSKVHSSKPRPSKSKAPQENTQKVDTQLKFQVCPLPLDGVFLRPIIAPIGSQNKPLDNAILPIDKMRPRFYNRRGRLRRHQPVQRQAPVSLFTAVTSPKSFKPIRPADPPVSMETPIAIGVKVAPVVPKEEVEKKVEGEVTQVPSPPSLSNLLDDLSLPSINSSRLSTPVPNFEGLLDGSDGGGNSLPLKNQWISTEVADLSLSGFSFLNNLDTDIKSIGDDTRLSDVDSQLRNLMNTDSSTDLNDIIADLTASIKTNTEPK